MIFNEIIEDIKVKRFYGLSWELFYSLCDIKIGFDWLFLERKIYFCVFKIYLGKVIVDMMLKENLIYCDKF